VVRVSGWSAPSTRVWSLSRGQPTAWRHANRTAGKCARSAGPAITSSKSPVGIRAQSNTHQAKLGRASADHTKPATGGPRRLRAGIGSVPAPDAGPSNSGSAGQYPGEGWRPCRLRYTSRTIRDLPVPEAPSSTITRGRETSPATSPSRRSGCLAPEQSGHHPEGHRPHLVVFPS
jgi:hypothetical protein